MTVTRESVLRCGGSGPRVHPVGDVPEWGGPAFVRELTVRERTALELRIEDARKGGQGQAAIVPLVVVACLCDEQGGLLLTDEDVEAVGDAAPSDPWFRVFAAAQDANGLTATSAEDLAGN